MRLSDIKGDRTFDVIADCIDPILNIAEDENAAEMFKRLALPEGMSPKHFLAERARKSLPVLMRGHKCDLITIMASMKGISEKEFLEQVNLVTLPRDVIELLTDELFLSFFTSDESGAGGNSSGAAPESSAGEA